MASPRAILFVAVPLLLNVCAGLAAPVQGEAVYRQKCAECHGQRGEGVEGKYADALYGDWGLPKLTRYIARNMPEENPETLSAAEADAVARYVYDAFYSRSAQARLRPARVELAYLTNQQYATAVADLLGHLAQEPERKTKAGDAAPVERGLTAFYYSVAQRGRFDGSKIVYAGVDARIDFDFARGSADRERAGDFEQFSMQWRGAVLAEETGDYEFIVRTPNSVRVWINRELVASEAVIDVNVSRPDQPEHRVTMRLLGGRRYPIAIDYWALPGKAGAPPPSISLRWRPPHGGERTIPARNLSTEKVRPTFVVQTRFPAGDSSRGYERSGSVSKGWDEATTRAAFEVANHAVKRMERLAGTKPGDPERARKVAAWAERFVAGAFRRPLSADEGRRYVTAHFEGEADVEAAMKRAVLLALKSPHFLYTELPVERPDGWRVAARLSLGLWDSVPDTELAGAAGEGRLGTRAEVAAQAGRMLRDPRARAKLREFFEHWLQLRYVEDLAKDRTLYPEFDDDMIDDLRTSLHLFLEDVAWSERSDFRELLRSDVLFVNAKLANFYGLPARAPGVSADEFVRVRTMDGQRSGVLTHPYLLAAFSYPSSTSPIHRGVFLTRSIVGRSLKSPPTAVAFDDTEFSPEMTMREKVVKLTSSESCLGCHAVINPLGFSLEWFDAAGRFRREEKGRPIDAVSEYLADEGAAVRFAGARDVAEFALASEQAMQAFVEQLFHHVVKQPAMAFGPEALPRLRETFVASGYHLQKLLVEIVSLSALRGVELPLAANTPTKETP